MEACPKQALEVLDMATFVERAAQASVMRLLRAGHGPAGQAAPPPAPPQALEIQK